MEGKIAAVTGMPPHPQRESGQRGPTNDVDDGNSDDVPRAKIFNADAPADCSPLVTSALTESCRTHNVPLLEMVSRAYHDSLFMSRVAPTAMLFIPCHQGYSHRPDEYSSPEDIARGTLILAETLARLSA